MTTPEDQAGSTERVRQSTQEIVAEAGLAPAAKTKRGSFALILALVVLGVLGIGGVLAIQFLREPESDTNRNPALLDPDPKGAPPRLSPAEAARLRRTLLEGEEATRRAKRRTVPDARQRALLEFYRQDQKIEIRPVATRGQADPMQPAAVQLDTGGAGTAVSDDATKVEAGPTNPANPPGAVLEYDHVHQVVGRHLKRIRRRLERLAGRDPGLHGKVEIVIRVHPSGKVGRVRVLTPRFQATPVADALHHELEQLRFEPFAGPARDVTIPLLIAPGS